jgi:putative hydrolase of HD superfamily
LNQITKDIGHVEIAAELVELWLEYEDGTTADALVAKQLDKFEMIVQADEYERAQGKRLQSFFTYTQESFNHPEILGWANELRDERYYIIN